jgi:hypothetical protein
MVARAVHITTIQENDLDTIVKVAISTSRNTFAVGVAKPCPVEKKYVSPKCTLFLWRN